MMVGLVWGRCRGMAQNGLQVVQEESILQGGESILTSEESILKHEERILMADRAWLGQVSCSGNRRQ